MPGAATRRSSSAPDHRWTGWFNGSMSRHRKLLDSKGVPVPGGFVTIDPYRGSSAVAHWLRLSLSIFWRSAYAASRSERDIVVLDEDHRETYREGPYNEITVNNPLDRIIAEIKASGMDGFLRVRHIELSQLGPMTKPGRVTLWQQMAPYLGRRQS